MTLDEAIKRIKEKMACDYNISGCDTCNISSCEDRDIVNLIAEWLKELKDYQDKNKMVVSIDVENMDSIKDKIEELSKYAERQYDKAIDDFVKLAKEHNWNIRNRNENEFIYGAIDRLAEQLKKCGKNG